MKTFIALSFALMILLTSCNTGKIPDNFDYGHVEGQVYKNEYFGMQLTVPQKWSVLTKEQMKSLRSQGADLVAGSNDKLKSVLKASEVKSADLIAVYQYELGSAVDYNPSMMIVVENVSLFSAIKEGSDYLKATRKIMSQSQIQYEYIDSNYNKTRFNGIGFYTMNAQMNYMNAVIKQTYFSTLMKGFAFMAIISYSTEEQKKSLIDILQTMRFKKGNN